MRKPTPASAVNVFPAQIAAQLLRRIDRDFDRLLDPSSAPTGQYRAAGTLCTLALGADFPEGTDTREQNPLDFSRFEGRFAGIERKALQLGDYSIDPYELWYAKTLYIYEINELQLVYIPPLF